MTLKPVEIEKEEEPVMETVFQAEGTAWAKVLRQD